MDDLKPEHQQFINEYFMQNMNATKAYKTAYDENLSDNVAAAASSRLLRDVKISNEVKRRLDEMAMPANELLSRLSKQASAKYTDFIGTDGKVDLDGLKKAGLMHLVKGTKYNARGDLMVEFLDPLKSQEMMGKYHAIFTDRLKVDGLPTYIIELIPHVKNMTVRYSDAVEYLGEDDAKKLFKEAGVNYE